MAVIMLFQFHPLVGQKYYSKAGRIQFLSDASLEQIEANNNSALIVLDVTTGRMDLSVLIKGFQFEKALMQDHFNENYMESHLYPKGSFTGIILNMKEINFNKDGTYITKVQGELTLHGVTKAMTTSGQINVKAGKIVASSTFDITIAEFNIDIPKVVKDNIAKTVRVTVSAELLLMK
jgi:polyisoprenoid-binding protein YceI